jgi:hypothetical protein
VSSASATAEFAGGVQAPHSVRIEIIGGRSKSGPGDVYDE